MQSRIVSNLRIWEAIGSDILALPMVGEKRDGVYKGMSKEHSTATKAYLRSEYDAMYVE